MTSEALAYLARLFSGERVTPYEVDDELGLKPWHPPASEVWQVGPHCPHAFSNAQAWAEAWSIVDRLHSEYVAARKRREMQ
jgi:hypothetical protein